MASKRRLFELPTWAHFYFQLRPSENPIFVKSAIIERLPVKGELLEYEEKRIFAVTHYYTRLSDASVVVFLADAMNVAIMEEPALPTPSDEDVA